MTKIYLGIRGFLEFKSCSHKVGQKLNTGISYQQVFYYVFLINFVMFNDADGYRLDV